MKINRGFVKNNIKPGLVLLVRSVGVRVARVQLGYHVDEGHVHEDAGRPHEDPGSQVLKVTQEHTDHHPDKGENGAKKRGYS